MTKEESVSTILGKLNPKGLWKNIVTAFQNDEETDISNIKITTGQPSSTWVSPGAISSQPPPTSGPQSTPSAKTWWSGSTGPIGTFDLKLGDPPITGTITLGDYSFPEIDYPPLSCEICNELFEKSDSIITLKLNGKLGKSGFHLKCLLENFGKFKNHVMRKHLEEDPSLPG